MKKLFTIISTVAVISMFSGCFFIASEDDPKIVIQKKTSEKVIEQTQDEKTTQEQQTVITKPVATSKYSITCRNQTNMIVTDWCVSKDNIVTYANSSFNRQIGPYKEDKIQNLPEGYYKIYFCFEDDYPLSPSDYLSSDSIQLNQDVIYTLFVRTSGYSVECRSAEVTPQFYLTGSDGSEINLICK